MTEGTRSEQVQDITNVSLDLKTAQAELDQSTHEAEAKVEKGDIQAAEKTREEFTALVDSLPDAKRGPGTEDGTDVVEDSPEDTADVELPEGAKAAPLIPGGAVVSAAVSGVGQMKESSSSSLADSSEDDDSEGSDEREDEESGIEVSDTPPDGSSGSDSDQYHADAAAFNQRSAADQVTGPQDSLEGAAAGLDDAGERSDAAEGALEEAQDLLEEKEDKQPSKDQETKPDDPRKPTAGDQDRSPEMEHGISVEAVLDPMDPAQLTPAEDGVPMSEVGKIDSFTWKMGVIKDEVGEFRIPTKHPTKIEPPPGRTASGDHHESPGDASDLELTRAENPPDYDPDLKPNPVGEGTSNEEKRNSSPAPAGAAGLPADGDPRSDPAKSYSGVEMTQGEVLQDSDWKGGSLGGEISEEPIPAGEDFSAGGVTDLKSTLSPFKNNLGQLRNMVAQAAGDEGGSLLIEIAPPEEISETPDLDWTSKFDELTSQARQVKEEIQSLKNTLDEMLPGVGQEVSYTTFEKTGEYSYQPVEITITVTTDGLVDIINELSQLHLSILNTMQEYKNEGSYDGLPVGPGAAIGGADQLWEPVDQAEAEQGLNVGRKVNPSLNKPESDQDNTEGSLSRDVDSKN